MFRRFRRLAAASLALALVAAACGNSGDDDDGDSASGDTSDVTVADPSARDTFVEITDVPGVDDDEIRFSSITTISNNPLGTNIGGAYNAGINAYFDYRNGQGGIYGRDLVLANERDDELISNDREAQAVVSEDDVFGAFVATLLFTGADILGESGVPTFGWNIDVEWGGKENLFGSIAPFCPECTGRTLPYIARELGATKIGILAYGTTDVSKVCAQTQRDSYELFADEAGGVEVAFFDDSLPFGLPNGVAPEVSAMKDAGVDFISTCIDLNGMKTLGDELAAQQLDATLYHPNTYNADFVAANADIFEGDIVVPQFLAFEAPGDIEIRDAYFDTIPADVAAQELAMTGWLNAHLAYTGLLAAGPDFDQAKVVDALRSTDGYTADGLSNSIDWSRQVDVPTPDTPEVDYEQECFNAVTVEDGEFVPWSGTDEEPWVCFDLPRDEWVEPVTNSYVE
jgi:ABC-type branched-subunit amino acid transport system substrate-binding protein